MSAGAGTTPSDEGKTDEARSDEARVDDSAASDPVAELTAALREFAAAREWEQFHSPKNLSMALIGECAEVVEHFQWLTEDASAALDAARREAVALELADVFIYTLRLADVLEVDLVAAARRKMRLNAERYPANRVRGDARRAREYGPD